MMTRSDDADAARLERVRQLKREGLSMTEIVARLGDTPAPASAAIPPAPTLRSMDALRVTVDDIDYPAYMVNHNFEVVWINDLARRQVFGGVAELPPTSEGRNLFRLLPAARNEWINLLRFHISVVKSRVGAEAFGQACRGLDPVAYARLQSAYVEADAEAIRPTLIAPVRLYEANGNENIVTAYASNYREGVFVALVPQSETGDELLDLLARRDEVIRSLLKRRLPVLTHLSVMIADLQSSVKICSELPPQEYFELINEIWTVMSPIFRKYHGTCGKHVGDGMLYYFFPQADSDYLMNALTCAHEMRLAMRALSAKWGLRKNWLNELFLNTGITEGQEWLGTYQSSTGIEFVVLGDTINQAARISELARYGAIWSTKSVIGKIPPEQLGRVSFGVRRRAQDGRDVFVPSSFSQVQNLIEQDGLRLEKLRDIATLPVTEITEIRPA
jgi:class 3 adenylate cyclase